jgi:hypothetical protein
MISETVYGKLTVIKSERRQHENRKGIGWLWWLCRCECGAEKWIEAKYVRAGYHKSCGCSRVTGIVNSQYRHGMSHTSIHNTWMSMKQRCFDVNCPAYSDYGGRGITVCERWMVFENFFEDVGSPPDGMTLDRFPNNDGNYEPGNVRWATKIEQGINRRNVHQVTIDGVTKTLREWCEQTGVKYNTAYQRIVKRKIDPREALKLSA